MPGRDRETAAVGIRGHVLCVMRLKVTACHKGAQDATAHVGLHLGNGALNKASRCVKLDHLGHWASVTLRLCRPTRYGLKHPIEHSVWGRRRCNGRRLAVLRSVVWGSIAGGRGRNLGGFFYRGCRAFIPALAYSSLDIGDIKPGFVVPDRGAAGSEIHRGALYTRYLSNPPFHFVHAEHRQHAVHFNDACFHRNFLIGILRQQDMLVAQTLREPAWWFVAFTYCGRRGRGRLRWK